MVPMFKVRLKMHNDILKIYTSAERGGVLDLEDVRHELDQYDSESLMRTINVLSVIIGIAALVAAERE